MKFFCELVILVVLFDVQGISMFICYTWSTRQTWFCPPCKYYYCCFFPPPTMYPTCSCPTGIDYPLIQYRSSLSSIVPSQQISHFIGSKYENEHHDHRLPEIQKQRQIQEQATNIGTGGLADRITMLTQDQAHSRPRGIQKEKLHTTFHYYRVVPGTKTTMLRQGRRAQQ